MSARDLHKIGYTVLETGITPLPEVFDFLRALADKKAAPIFNYGDAASQRNDNRRAQCNVPARLPKAVEAFTTAIDTAIMASGFVPSTLIASQSVVLRSAPGCRAQAAHCDFSPDDAMRALWSDATGDALMPILALTVLQGGTRINVWPGSIRGCARVRPLGLRPRVAALVPIACQVLDLHAGQVVLFRADLVHAGAAYDSLNYRMHRYYDSPAVPRVPNRTWVVHREADAGEMKRWIVPVTDRT